MDRPPTPSLSPSLSTSISTVTITTLWKKLSEFVMIMCYERDESHGYKHMESVAHLSCKILEFILDSIECSYKHELRVKVLCVAWLHDIGDHKYNDIENPKIKIKSFLTKIFDNPYDVEDTIRVIDYISFTNEQIAITEQRPIDFELLLGPRMFLVRNIVSDADKLESLGKKGFDRCVQYAKEDYMKQHGSEISYDQLKLSVTQHAHEKILKLKDQFIRTSIGKLLAISLHDEFVVELNKM